MLSFFGAGAASWATGAAAWGIGVAAWGAANKGGATSGRGIVTISFRLITMFSSPLARLALILHADLCLPISHSFLRPAQYIHLVCFLPVLVLCSALA